MLAGSVHLAWVCRKLQPETWQSIVNNNQQMERIISPAADALPGSADPGVSGSLASKADLKQSIVKKQHASLRHTCLPRPKAVPGP